MRRPVRRGPPGQERQRVRVLLQVPGQEGPAATLVLWAVAVSVGAVLVSEWLARRMAARISGAAHAI